MEYSIKMKLIIYHNSRYINSSCIEIKVEQHTCLAPYFCHIFIVTLVLNILHKYKYTIHVLKSMSSYIPVTFPASATFSVRFLPSSVVEPTSLRLVRPRPRMWRVMLPTSPRHLKTIVSLSVQILYKNSTQMYTINGSFC